MRAKAIFTVFGRKLASGKTVFYYQCYDAKGKRLWAKSTGLHKKTEATAYCMKLYRDGLLIPSPKVPTFGEYAEGWFDIETCRYLKWRQLHEPLSQGSIDIHKNNLTTHLKDFFSKYKLDEIDTVVLEDWFLNMTQKEVKSGSGVTDGKTESKKLKPGSINLAYRTLRLMLGEAVRLKIIRTNPTYAVKELTDEENERVILTLEEIRKLFPAQWDTVWDNRVAYKANRLAAGTGMRIGEIRGLRGEHIHEDYIQVAGQYTRKGYKPKTKTKKNRDIPINQAIRRELEELIAVNKDGYVFSEDKGVTPIRSETIERQYNRALERIGIDDTTRKKRNLTFHAWRHFFNTLLRMKNIADSKVQSVTGHLTKKQVEHYTHFDTRQFTEVRDAQTALLTAGEGKRKKKAAKAKTETAQTVKTKTKTKKATA
jgi:integrase